MELRTERMQLLSPPLFLGGALSVGMGGFGGEACLSLALLCSSDWRLSLEKRLLLVIISHPCLNKGLNPQTKFNKAEACVGEEMLNHVGPARRSPVMAPGFIRAVRRSHHICRVFSALTAILHCISFFTVETSKRTEQEGL